MFQTSANFQDRDLDPSDGILIASDLSVCTSLTQVPLM